MNLEYLHSIDWSFRKVKAKEGIHGLHPYPAMMAPPIAQTLIKELSNPYDLVLDPFCGSGTVIAEAMRLRRFAIGVDINPLALLIARVKANPLPMEKLKSTFKWLEKQWKILKHIEPPRFNNIDYWFKPEVQEKLAILKASIETLEDDEVREFCLVVLSRVIRDVSNARSDEFKLYRMPTKELLYWNPDVFHIFHKRFWECAIIMHKWFIETKDIDTHPTLLLHDARQSLPVQPESVDLVLTSPPYGDSRTTVAYGQFSRLSLQWLGLWEKDIDRISLGGSLRQSYLPSPTLSNILDFISQKDKKRADEVLAFYADLNDCLFNITKVVKIGGYAVFVVANRKVKGIVLPTDKIIAELLPEFELITSFSREIPNKRMPLRNSPSNVAGETDNTMLTENILVFKKLR